MYKKVFKELSVAYHSCLKKLVKLPSWTRNHDMCLNLGLLPCHMLLASRKLSFWRRLLASDNTMISALLASDIGDHGLLAKSQLQVRREHNLIDMDLRAVSGPDIVNVFASRLERFVLERNRLP